MGRGDGGDGDSRGCLSPVWLGDGASGFHLRPVGILSGVPEAFPGLPGAPWGSRGAGVSANWDQARQALQRLWGPPAPAGAKPGLPEQPVDQAAGEAGLAGSALLRPGPRGACEGPALARPAGSVGGTG